MARLQGVGQVAEWFKAAVLKTHTVGRQKSRFPRNSNENEPRRLRRSRIVHRFAMAHMSAQVGPARRQPDRALPHEGRVRMAYRYCEDRIARQKQENFEKHTRQFHADADGVAPHHGYCYFIGEPDGDLVKIGYSKNPTHRLSQLRAEHSPDLRLLAKCFGGYTREGAYHAQFAHLRYKGEWFTVTDEIKAEIERLNSNQIDGVSAENRSTPYAGEVGKPGHCNGVIIWEEGKRG